MSRDYKFHNHRTGQYAEGLSYDKNGNIASIAWRTKTDNITRGYGYDYDHLNRLNYASNLKALGGPSFFVNLGRDGQYAEDLSYDKNGNITTLKRYGQEELGQPIEIDDLTYTYTANQLQTVTDATNNPEGFNDGNTTGVDYVYDSFGNMITDKNKGITNVTYNHLNLPVEISFASGKINYTYDATGSKLKKVVTPTGGASTTTVMYNNTVRYNNCSGGIAPAGCVAVAMGQIMKYHNHPNLFNIADMYPYVTSGAPYPHNNINASNIANLLGHIGSNIGMNYSCTRSGAYSQDARTAFNVDYDYVTNQLQGMN